MKRAAFAVALAVATGPVLAEDDVVPSTFQFGEIDFGVSARSEDTNSSKFQEYRDIPNGFVLPLFRLDGQKDGFRYNLFGSDARERDQQYRLGARKGAGSRSTAPTSSSRTTSEMEPGAWRTTRAVASSWSATRSRPSTRG